MRKIENIEVSGETVREIINGRELTDLSNADLRDAFLSNADLRDADLSNADLRGADLSNADLRGADLRGADLRHADLRGADLRHADLSNADLKYAKLDRAILPNSNLPKYKIIPEEGSFIAYKKCKNNIVKLKIPTNADRTSTLTSRKCRASKALVLEVLDEKGENSTDRMASSRYESGFSYIEGEEVTPDSYNDDIRVECSHGIHFFPTKQEAIDW